MNMMVPLTKMVAAGNDFLVVDTVRHSSLRRWRAQWPGVSRLLCARHTGVGGDGLLVLEPSPRTTGSPVPLERALTGHGCKAVGRGSRAADVRMRVFNPDGSEAEMCGNGARCVAVYQQSAVSNQQSAKTPRLVAIETKAGVMDAVVRGKWVSMRMPDPAILGLKIPVRLNGAVYPVTLVNTGVPHAVLFVKDLERVDVETLGRTIRRHQVFGSQGTNVDFVQVQRPGAIAIRTYERGVEGETLGCGTGVAACAVAHAMGRVSQGAARVDVRTRSGEWLAVSLHVRRVGRAASVSDLILEGQARTVFDGTIVLQRASGWRGVGEQRLCVSSDHGVRAQRGRARNTAQRSEPRWGEQAAQRTSHSTGPARSSSSQAVERTP